MKDIVFLFPGQGSQYVGMGKAFAGQYASVARLFEEASDLIGKDMKQLCFEGPEATLIQTDNVQPAITLVNLACHEVLCEEGLTPSATAGHSLGEYSALAAAGVFSFRDVLRLVHVRGAAMRAAAERNPGGMVSVFGLDFETLQGICDEVRDAGSVEVANHNSPLQVALTGDPDGLQKASQLAKQRGAKLIVPLKVSGAWHSKFMAPAQGAMREALGQSETRRPSMPVMANVTGEPHATNPDEIRAVLVDQLVRPVRWSHAMRHLIDRGHRLFLEVGPGKVLAGLMRDISREVKVFGVQDPESLAKARSALAERAT